MEKIICSLEDWDSIFDYYRPNGSSKTWYIKESKKLAIPQTAIERQEAWLKNCNIEDAETEVLINIYKKYLDSVI